MVLTKYIRLALAAMIMVSSLSGAVFPASALAEEAMVPVMQSCCCRVLVMDMTGSSPPIAGEAPCGCDNGLPCNLGNRPAHDQQESLVSSAFRFSPPALGRSVINTPVRVSSLTDAKGPGPSAAPGPLYILKSSFLL